MALIQNPLVAESVLTIKPLDSFCDRAAFVCQEQPLTDYMQGDKALRDAREKLASVYCCVDEEQCVKAYYTLSAGSIPRDSVIRAMYGAQWMDNSKDKHKIYRKYPYPSIGVIVLGRIAIDLSLKGTGFGRKLIGHALNNAVEASRSVAAKAVYLDAKNDAVAEIYRSIGFRSFPDDPRSMFILMETLEQASQQAES